MAGSKVDNHPSPEVDLAGTFRKIDVDGSGTLTKDELWDHVGRTTGLSKKDFDVLFDVLDQDKSGSVDYAEYSCFMHQVIGRTEASKRRRSSMKVPTQRASIISVSERRPLKKDKHEHHKHHSFRRVRSRLHSTRRQSHFRGKGMNFDESLPKIAPAETKSAGNVRFFDVEVREYKVTVSDNPGVKAGVALELGWDYNVLERTHLDTFEDKRSQERSPNFKKEKKLTKLERERVLKEFGATQKEIDDAAKRAALIRNGRKKSIEMRQHDKLHESVEGKMRGLKKLLGIGRRKSAPPENTVDMERLHPTLMAMMGVDDSVHDSVHETAAS